MIALYRMYDVEHTLLYVGVTLSLVDRVGSHQTGSAFWPDVRTITVEHYADRPTALKAEVSAIQLEHPTYNVSGKKHTNVQVIHNATCRRKRLGLL